MGTFSGVCVSCEDYRYNNALMVGHYKIAGYIHYIPVGRYAGRIDDAAIYNARFVIFENEWKQYSKDGCITLTEVHATILPKETDPIPQVSISSPDMEICLPHRKFFPFIQYSIPAD